jgi:Ca2+-binding RTX toxin-like protein
MSNLKGTSGHDTVRGTITNDLIEGLAGNDHLFGLAGNDILRGGDGQDDLFGESGNDTLDGGTLNDWLHGGLGNDLLTGGSGAEQFVFDTALNATSNVDTITDFTSGSDKIWLNYSIFNKLTINGGLEASMLRIGSAAADANDFIIYNPNNGALSYDSKGNAAGGAVQFATRRHEGRHRLRHPDAEDHTGCLPR